LVLIKNYINTLQRILAAYDAAVMASCHDCFSSTLQVFKKYFIEFALGSNVSFNV
jgi:hypothetical protein